MARGVLLRSTLAALSAAALALPAAASGEPAPRPAAKRPLLVYALVSTRAPGRRVARSYAGFSVDYPRVVQLIGNTRTGPNPEPTWPPAA